MGVDSRSCLDEADLAALHPSCSSYRCALPTFSLFLIFTSPLSRIRFVSIVFRPYPLDPCPFSFSSRLLSFFRGIVVFSLSLSRAIPFIPILFQGFRLALVLDRISVSLVAKHPCHPYRLKGAHAFPSSLFLHPN